MKLKHFDNDGSVRFVTFCTHRRVPVFTNDCYRTVFVDELRIWINKNRIRLLAWVLMPEHVHLVLHPLEKIPLGSAIGDLKLSVSMKLHKLMDDSHDELLNQLKVCRDGEWRFVLWQKRCYDHNCRSEASIWEKVRYCHENPVKRGLVANPLDWKWGSSRSYGGKPDALVNIEF